VSGDQENEDRQELLKLYELALQEYRFQVLLNWDRLKHAFVVDGVLVAAAAAIWKLGNGADPPVVVAWILALAAANSVLGILGSRTGHSYYRETRKVKTTIEQKLGLPENGMALSSTVGMREGHQPETTPFTLPRRVWRWATRVNTYLEFVLLMVAVLAGSEAIIIFRSHP
jgi:hypothetical protein